MKNLIQCCDILPRQKFQHSYAANSLPVVFTGGMDHWYRSSVWNFDWFREHYSNLAVWVRMGMTTRCTTLGEYFDEIERGATVEQCGYLAQVNLRNFPELLEKVIFPKFYWLKLLTNIFVWMGPTNTKTLLHCDFQDNLVAQVIGRKRFLLYSPSATSRIPLGHKTFVSWTSGLSFESPPPPDPDFDFILEPGQILYLPPHWWHQVTSIEPSISVNEFWWKPTTLAKQSPHFFASQQLHQRIINAFRSSRLR